MFYADRNVRPCTILGYTLTTFPKSLIQTKQQKEQLHQIAICKRRRTLQLDNIPELETDKENWDKGQFDDAELLYNHNSTEESDRICREYSAHFQKVEEQQYSPYLTAQGIKYTIPEPDYYHSSSQQKQEQKQQNQKVYLAPPPISRTYAHGTVEEEEEQDA